MGHSQSSEMHFGKIQNSCLFQGKDRGMRDGKKCTSKKNMFLQLLSARHWATANKDANENQNQIEKDPEIERCTFAKVGTRNEQT